MKHILKLSDLVDFVNVHKVRYAASSTENKQLYITVKGTYEIWHNNKKVLDTDNASKVIEMYNSIT